MFTYLVRRLIMLVLTLLGVVTVVFILMRLLPGDPALIILGDYATHAQIVALHHKLGLDKPLYTQYGEFLWQVAHGSFGRSFMTNIKVLPEIVRVFPYTLELALGAVIFSVIVGVPTGILSANRRNTLADHTVSLFALLGLAGPSFWYGIMSLLVFSVWLHWFPLLGTNAAHSTGEVLKYTILPAIILGFNMVGLTSRMTRSSMLDVLSRDYVRTARAKGLSDRVIVYKHALRNALIPIVTVVAGHAGRVLGGAVVIEMVFVRPGLGSMLVQSISQRDYTMVQGITLFFAVLVVFVNLLLDLSYTILDPRVQYK